MEGVSIVEIKIVDVGRPRRGGRFFRRELQRTDDASAGPTVEYANLNDILFSEFHNFLRNRIMTYRRPRSFAVPKGCFADGFPIEPSPVEIVDRSAVESERGTFPRFGNEDFHAIPCVAVVRGIAILLRSFLRERVERILLRESLFFPRFAEQNRLEAVRLSGLAFVAEIEFELDIFRNSFSKVRDDRVVTHPFTAEEEDSAAESDIQIVEDCGPDAGDFSPFQNPSTMPGAILKMMYGRALIFTFAKSAGSVAAVHCGFAVRTGSLLALRK